jgi:hypothetical protein
MHPNKASQSGKPASPMRIIIPALVLVLAFVLIVLRAALPLVESRMLARSCRPQCCRLRGPQRQIAVS